MGSILINYPDIPESDLVFDERETRAILRFFWPDLNDGIEAMNVTADTRRFAQTLLIAAVDGSYAMGFIHGLADVIVKRTPGAGIRVLARKLGTRYVKHWWQHTTREDLLDARIYDSVRTSVARSVRNQMDERLSGVLSMKRRLSPFYATAGNGIVWS